jgi:hypothetical protein
MGFNSGFKGLTGIQPVAWSLNLLSNRAYCHDVYQTGSHMDKVATSYHTHVN